MSFKIFSAYQFVELPAGELSKLKNELIALGTQLKIQGLILLACEGTNFTISGTSTEIEAFLRQFNSLLATEPFALKESFSEKKPFRRLRVDIREEIVTFDGKKYTAKEAPGTHLSPETWQHVLDTEEVVLLDVRNTYETSIGMFAGAVDPRTAHFSHFPKFLREWDIPRDKKILTYCTGGVRCEKAVVEMQRQGFSNVFQLDGGILNYLKSFPHGKFQGECFVFDHRVSLDGNLEPSKRYVLCPHCGDPGDQKTVCEECGQDATVCARCLNQLGLAACSKNCAYHIKRKAA